MADIMQPWTQRATQTFTGTGTQAFKLPLTLDGAFTLQLEPKPGYDLVVRSGGKVVGRTNRPRPHPLPDRLP